MPMCGTKQAISATEFMRKYLVLDSQNPGTLGPDLKDLIIANNI
jgi:hypothetical protein